MKHKVINIAVILLLSMTGVASAVTPNDVELLQKKLQKMVSLQGQFTQQLFSADNELLGETNTGHFVLQRPGRFYWKTVTPFEQLLVSDQQTIWLYEPDLEQVTVRPFSDDMQQTPALLLSDDTAKLEASYLVVAKTTTNKQAFVLTPKLASQLFESMELIFKDDALETIIINDGLAQRTVFTLQESQMNLPIKEEMFTFSIPEGVDVMID